MIKHASFVCAMATSIALPLSVYAEPFPGAPIVVPADGTTVTLEYVSFEALYTGELSFLGGGTDLQVTLPVGDTGLPGLGQQTFVNQQPLNDSVTLEGTYDAGDVLHFAYRVTDPTEAEDTLRTDEATESSQYSWDSVTGLLAIEDLRPDHPWYDADYDDLVVRVTFSNVPGPGTAVAALFGSLAIVGRRRRLA